MSRWGIDPPDDDAYDIRYDGTACDDCGGLSVAWLCETCSDQREYWAVTTEARLATERLTAIGLSMVRAALQPAVVDVALVPVSPFGPIVEVALVPTDAVRVLSAHDARDVKRMARAFLAADLSNVKDVA